MLKGYLVPHPPLIVPGIGNGSEIPDTRQAYGKVAQRIREENPDTIIVFSPHSIMYRDYIHIAPGKRGTGDFGAFQAPNISTEVLYDFELANQISQIAEKENIPAGLLGEREPLLDHGVMVPLHFIGTRLPIVRISLSGLSLAEHYRFGMCVRKAAESLSRRIVLLASGDMSHKLITEGPYGFAKEGPQFDDFVCRCVENGDFKSLLTMDQSLYEGAAECGLRSLVMLLGALDGLAVTSSIMCYEGPFGVGYLTASFSAEGQEASLLSFLAETNAKQMTESRENEDSYVQLARSNIEYYVVHGEMITLPSDLPSEMLSQSAGVFVSIKKNGRLRGCIGTTAPTQIHIAMEILRNSVAAAMEDPRFEPIQIAELAALTYSVDVLSPAEPIDSPDLLDVSRYGVIVTRGRKRGLLLPNLDGVDSIEQQIDIAKEKAGIEKNQSCSLERFEVVRHI